MTQFRPIKAFLFKKKGSANRKARQLRKEGFRVEVQRASAITRKRSPQCQWTVFKGQKRK